MGLYMYIPKLDSFSNQIYEIWLYTQFGDATYCYQLGISISLLDRNYFP